MNKEISLRKILPVMFGFFIMGFVDIVGVSTSYVKNDFAGMNDTMVNLISLSCFLWFFLLSIPTGMLMNRIGRKKTVLLSFALHVAAMIVPLIAYDFTAVLIAFALIGIGNTLLQVSLNPLVTNVIAGDKLTGTLTLGQFVKAVSSFLGPIIAAAVTGSFLGWKMIFPIYAAISLLALVWLWLTPIAEIRNFWIEHTKRCRAIAEEMGKAQGDPCIMNVWVHDGSKDLTVNRMKYRELLCDSLDKIFEKKYDNMKDCIESKVFGIGLESYTVGSNDFYIGYGTSRGKIVTLDTGHFHPTEVVADKLSSLLLFTPEIMLHVSRPVRWDSDHVTIMNDETLELCKEIVRCDALDRVHIGLDYFDASINRIGAYVIGSRATQKCMMQALLEPLAKLREYEANGQGFERLALLEESKSLPWNAVWDMFCLRNNVPVGEDFIAEIQKYEREVTSKRA